METTPAGRGAVEDAAAVQMGAFARFLVAADLAGRHDKDCEPTGFSGEGRCIEAAVAMTWRHGQAGSRVLVVRPAPGDGSHR